MSSTTRPIEWRVHLRSAPEAVFETWTTDAGRARFWAERSESAAGGFELHFVNGQNLSVKVAEERSPERFAFRYFGGSTVTVTLSPDGAGGCDLHLVETGIASAEEWVENHAGWVSVLMALKAAVDFGVDLRAHDPARTWEGRYVDC